MNAIEIATVAFFLAVASYIVAWGNVVKFERRSHEHRPNSPNPEGGARALPAGTPGKRPGGAQPVAGTGVCACGHPITVHGNVGCTALILGYYCPCSLQRHKLEPASPDPEPESEEILAWRGWDLVGYSSGDVEVVRLRSLTRIFLWDSPSVVADRRPSQHSAHGLYAMRTRGQFVAQYTPHVLGQVALSGIVVEGENGYRAERATIRSLIITHNPFPDVPLIVLADRLANHYQCEVTWEIEEPKPDRDRLMLLSGNINAPVWWSASNAIANATGRVVAWPISGPAGGPPNPTSAP